MNWKDEFLSKIDEFEYNSTNPNNGGIRETTHSPQVLPNSHKPNA